MTPSERILKSSLFQTKKTNYVPRQQMLVLETLSMARRVPNQHRQKIQEIEEKIEKESKKTYPNTEYIEKCMKKIETLNNLLKHYSR